MTSSNATDPSLVDRFTEHLARLAGMSFPYALTSGDRAPEFTLQNATGRMVRLDELLERGPVVLTFYRGAWCPYCNTQLRSLQKALPEIEALGASLVAVSPELPDGSLGLIDENAITFEVLSDVKSRVAFEYGIAFALAPADRALFLEVGNDLAQGNGDDSWVLPAPATFVIAPDGTIRHARIDADFTKRIEPDEIVGALRALAATEGGTEMVTVGLSVRLTAAPGKEDEVAAFLESALPLVDAEPETTAWFAARVDTSTFLIFDVFPGESGREQHLAGPVADALAARAAELFAEAPAIERFELLAVKLPD